VARETFLWVWCDFRVNLSLRPLVQPSQHFVSLLFWILLLFIRLSLARELLSRVIWVEVNWNCSYKENWRRSQDEDFRFQNNPLSGKAILLCRTTIATFTDAKIVDSLIYGGRSWWAVSLHTTHFKDKLENWPPWNNTPLLSLSLSVFCLWPSLPLSVSLSQIENSFEMSSKRAYLIIWPVYLRKTCHCFYRFLVDPLFNLLLPFSQKSWLQKIIKLF